MSCSRGWKGDEGPTFAGEIRDVAMAKTGNAFLREAAYRMAIVGIQHNPVIRAHYARKRAAGKSRMNVVGHCMSKALSLVWGVGRGGKGFDAAHGSAATTPETALEP
ncbi:MAG: hypothetical protein ABSE84_26045 [Isosphaeraceae bacterium]